MNRTGETNQIKLTGKGRTLIVENSLDGNDVGLNKIGVRVWTQWGYTHGVCLFRPHASHGVNYDVLFDSEWSRIKRDTKEGNLRHVTSPQMAYGQGQKDGNVLDCARGLDLATEGTEMTEKRGEDKPKRCRQQGI